MHTPLHVDARKLQHNQLTALPAESFTSLDSLCDVYVVATLLTRDVCCGGGRSLTAVCVRARAVPQRCFQQQAGLPTNISLARPRLQRWRPSHRDRGPARMRVLVSVRAAPLAPLSTLSVLVLTTSWGVAQVLQECLQQQP